MLSPTVILPLLGKADANRMTCNAETFVRSSSSFSSITHLAIRNSDFTIHDFSVSGYPSSVHPIRNYTISITNSSNRRFSFVSCDTRLPQKPNQQAYANVSAMWIGNNQPLRSSKHEHMSPSRIRTFKTQLHQPLNLRFPVVLPQGFLIALSLTGEGRGEVQDAPSRLLPSSEGE